MVFQKAVTLTVQAEVDLADPANVAFPAAVLAGLAFSMYRGMEEGQIKPHSLIWGVAAVSPDRHRDISTSGTAVNR